MKTDRKHIAPDELLVKYLAGEASADESAEAELWIGASDENREYFGHFKIIWDESQKLARDSNADENAAWNRFRERVQKEYIATSKTKYNFQWLKVAAIIVLVSAAALIVPYFFKRGDSRTAFLSANNPPVKLLTSATANNTRVDTLPDGSIITLNKYSSLKYPEGFKGDKRNVELSGEAFFNVKHDQSKPFVINVNDVLITVMGTSFNVKSNGGITAVIVESGIVGVKKHKHIITLYAGEKLTTSMTDSALVKSRNTNNLYRSYIDKIPSISYIPNNARTKTDTPFDINKHPDLLQKILRDPAKWAKLLRSYQVQGDDITVRRAVIRKVMDEITTQRLIGSEKIRSFKLDEKEFIINDKKQPGSVHQRFKDAFIKEAGYVIYLGDAPKKGKGIYLSPDSL